jgi:hypothetical protein
MNLLPTKHAWERRAHDRAFWGEMTPCEHTVQIYGDSTVFLDALEGFVADGLEGGEGVIVIATEAHRKALDARLAERGIDLEVARSSHHYFALDAEETMMRFLVTGWPDERLFESVVGQLIRTARSHGRPVRAFGEMVALMWAQGMSGGTVKLEHLWHQFCQQEKLPLFCAYPRTGFTQDAEDSIRQICAAHSRVLAA